MENSEACPRLTAVIEIGSTGIRLLLAEIEGNGKWKEMDRAGKPVALGRDVFTTGQISRESFLECLSVLKNYREALSAWGISGSDVHVIATSALRAARNRDLFTDQVSRQTGFKINIVEGIEENRLMYLAVRFALKNDLPQFRRSSSMIIEIGGGSTEIMLLRQGKMVAAHSLRLGTILIDQRNRLAMSTARSKERYLNENIRNTSIFLSSEMELSQVHTLVAAASDARIAAHHIGTVLNEHCRVIDRKSFTVFVEELQSCSTEECVQKLQISFVDAEGLISGLLILKLFLNRTSAVRIVVPRVSIREGLLLDLALGVETELQEEFFSQIIASAVNLGRKYHFDEAHSRFVADLSLTLFDALIQEHGMNRRERMLLEAAAILHDIGMFIRGSHHEKHGQYIVANSEIFGLRQDELGIIANVIRYHRSHTPSSADIEYIALQREERILVQKIAAILRVADALDRGHSQQTGQITVERKGDILALHTERNRDLSLEHIGLDEKADMFQDVYGYKVVLS
ncbi:MAG: HD domain-containing protein [Treponema sp.]|jgi:exopolyphosphatase/guanosine-5'-triphosphate,3'-diphosphate pyrophosphatase|nr:HD domain-containing protein [Treponema sp.]